jgi:superfamily I DNA/RNA helicase/mRNA-degrading endonuclease RelE of RelBE toxin-antitoxin system
LDIKVAITKSYSQSLIKLPKDIQKRASKALEKFMENPDSAALNYEKINDCLDDKVRTIRITQKYRAIVLHPEEGNIYLFVHVDNHDEAIDWAKNKRFDINQYTSALQVVDMELVNQAHVEEVFENPVNQETSISDKYSEDELIEIGIPRMMLPILKYVRNMEDLINSVKGYVSNDIFEVLEFCVSGFPVEEIKDCFSQEPVLKEDTLSTLLDKQINQSYIKVFTDDEEIKKVLDDPIDYWRIFIHPVQRKYVIGNDGNYNGSFQLKGSAGTGKTVVAMHRAKYLAENVYTSEGDQILYTTFSKKLTKSVEYNLKNMCDLEILKRIEVVHLHSLIAKYLKKYNVTFNIIDDKTRKILIGYAISKAGCESEYSVNDIVQELDVVFSFYMITDKETYLKVSRNGTYKKLGRNQRGDVWRIISEYYELLHDMNSKEWWLVINDAVNMLISKKELPYKAIIVDEAQDFGMAEYRFLRALVPEKENDLFIVGDIRQQIYENRINFSRCNINILGNRTRNMTLNYRNTFEINQMADQIINGVQYQDLDGTVLEDIRSHAIIKGEKPIIQAFDTPRQEIDFIADEINRIAGAGIMLNEIAVVARTNNQLKSAVQSLEEKGISAITLDDVDTISNRKIYYGTMHSIKGFEFKVIFLIGANSEMIPLKSVVDGLENEKEIAVKIRMEKSLLYVAVTRARDMLYVTGSQDVSGWIGGEI